MNKTEATSQNIVGQIGLLSESRSFTEDEAKELISLLVVISERTKKEINNYNAQLAYFKNNPSKVETVQEKINHSLHLWSEKMRRLGALPVAFLKVKIPTDNGHFYWEYPSTTFYLQ